tara:strand:- start:2992 stop:3426 length:435 start_codon:yes stop_codon:yes gene_type:complete
MANITVDGSSYWGILSIDDLLDRHGEVAGITREEVDGQIHYLSRKPGEDGVVPEMGVWLDEDAAKEALLDAAMVGLSEYMTSPLIDSGRGRSSRGIRHSMTSRYSELGGYGMSNPPNNDPALNPGLSTDEPDQRITYTGLKLKK